MSFCRPLKVPPGVVRTPLATPLGAGALQLYMLISYTRLCKTILCNESKLSKSWNMHRLCLLHILHSPHTCRVECWRLHKANYNSVGTAAGCGFNVPPQLFHANRQIVAHVELFLNHLWVLGLMIVVRPYFRVW